MSPRDPHGELHSLEPEKIKAAREKMMLTQAQLGAELGISNVEIHRKELPPNAKEHRPIKKVQVLALRWLLHLWGCSDEEIAEMTGAD